MIYIDGKKVSGEKLTKYNLPTPRIGDEKLCRNCQKFLHISSFHKNRATCKWCTKILKYNNVNKPVKKFVNGISKDSSDLRIVTLLSHGLDIKEIAKAFDADHKAIKKRIESLMTKLKTTRIGMVAKYLRSGAIF